MNRTLPLLLGLAIALAGCAEPQAEGDEPEADADAQRREEARSLLLAAGQDFPDRFTFELGGSNARGEELLRVRGAVDGESTYVEFDADPAFAAAASQRDGGADPAAAFFGSSFRMHVSPDGMVYLADGAALAFPPGHQSAFTPDPSQTPAAAFTDPEALFAQLAEAGVNVTAVESVTYRDEPALRVEFSFEREDDAGTGTAYVFQEPTRLAHLTVETQATTADEPSRFTSEFHYGDDEQLAPSEGVVRALALAYRSDANPFGGAARAEDGGRVVTWTFLRSDGVLASDAELVAYDSAHEGERLVPEDGAVLWRMGLEQGAAEREGANVTFVDADADGLVSAGDTLRVQTPEGAAMPGLVLRDRVTGVHVFELNTLIAAFASAHTR